MQLFVDGFNNYTTTTNGAAKYGPAGNLGSGALSAGNGRRGLASYRVTLNTGGPYKVLAPADATFIMGHALRLSIAAQYVKMDVGSDVSHVQIRLLSDGSFAAYRGGSTLIGTASAAGAYTMGTYQYVWIKVVIHDTTGSVVIEVNGTTVLNLTNVDTRNGGTAGYTYVQMWQTQVATTTTLDMADLVIFDGSGSSHNAFMGDLRVDTGVTTANGNTSGSTPSTGTNRGTTIDEVPPSTTDYNSLAAVNDKDTLTLADFPVAGGIPLGVQVCIHAAAASAGIAALAPVLRHGGTDYVGSSPVYHDTTARFGVVAQYPLNPAGGAWTESDYNALEVGYQRTA